jgi:hypothetical protein
MAAALSSPLEGIATPEKTPPIKLAICVTFHYVETRLKYLAALSSRFGSLAQSVAATIVTNTGSAGHHAQISEIFRKDGVDIAIFTPTGLGHPFLLTWSHFVVMREKFKDASFTHFLYLEDDLLCTQEHINYMLEAREMLRPIGAIPGMFRVEQNPVDGEWYSTDQLKRIDISKCPRIPLPVDSGLGFINLPLPYQGMYFLDRELMAEHLGGPSSMPDFGKWPIREKAAQGLTFVQVPAGLSSRVMVPYYENEKRIAQCCLLHHMTNSYVLHPKSPHGKIKVKDIFL